MSPSCPLQYSCRLHVPFIFPSFSLYFPFICMHFLKFPVPPPSVPSFPCHAVTFLHCSAFPRMSPSVTLHFRCISLHFPFVAASFPVRFLFTSRFPVISTVQKGGCQKRHCFQPEGGQVPRLLPKTLTTEVFNVFGRKAQCLLMFLARSGRPEPAESRQGASSLSLLFFHTGSAKACLSVPSSNYRATR